MHLLMAFIASMIGKLFGDGGLLQLLTLTDVYAEATARQMLQGKQLSRAVRGIKLVAKAILHLYVISAKEWSEEHNLQWLHPNTAQGLSDLPHTFRVQDKLSTDGVMSDLDVSPAIEAMHKF